MVRVAEIYRAAVSGAVAGKRAVVTAQVGTGKGAATAREVIAIAAGGVVADRALDSRDEICGANSGPFGIRCRGMRAIAGDATVDQLYAVGSVYTAAARDRRAAGRYLAVAHGRTAQVHVAAGIDAAAAGGVIGNAGGDVQVVHGDPRTVVHDHAPGMIAAHGQCVVQRSLQDHVTGIDSRENR